MRYGATGMQGWRNTMEDSHIASLDLGNGVAFFGVYDGHGGKIHYFDILSNLVVIFSNFFQSYVIS